MDEGRLENWNIIFVNTEMLVCLLGVMFNGSTIFAIFWNVQMLVVAFQRQPFLSWSVSRWVIFFLCDTRCRLQDIADSKTFSEGMAVWFGWMPQVHVFMTFLLALVFITHLVAVSVFNYHQISHQRHLTYLTGLLDLLACLQRGTIIRMVEIEPGGNKCNMLS